MTSRAFLILMCCDSRWKVQGLGGQLCVEGVGDQDLKESGCGGQVQQVRAPRTWDPVI